MAAWASPAEVTEVTGVIVEEATVNLAQAVIESVVGRTTLDNDRLSARDLLWLKRAVAYQAAWMPAQPDLFTRTEVRSSSQDGASAAYTGGEDQVLAPLAKRTLRRLSWRGSKSIQVRQARRRGYVDPAGAMVVEIHDYPGEAWVQE